MRNFVPIIRRSLLVLSPLALAAATAVSAAPASGNSVAPVIRSAMERDLGLSGAQLSQYLQTERLARAEQTRLSQAQGRNFGGSWIERQANGRYQLVVGTTSLQPRAAPAGVEIRHLRHSLASLKASKQQLDTMLAQGARTPKGVYGWYVDQPSNSVVVTVGKGGLQAGIDFVAASGADADSVRFETLDEQPTLRVDIQGGRGYNTVPGDGYIYACSVGFSVTQGSTPGFVSAGHCGDTGTTVYNEDAPFQPGARIGTFAGSSFPQPGGTGPDYSWVRVDAGNPLLPSVYGYGYGDVTVTGHAEAPIGGAICRSGRTTGWHCGTIQAKNVTITYSTGETVLNLTQTTACSEGGDSGGSYINGTGDAQGVLSGGSGSCKGDKNTTFSATQARGVAQARKGKPGGGGGGGKPSRARTFFTPVNPILQAYNLNIVTGN